MKKRLLSLALALVMLFSLLPTITLPAAAATAPTALWIEATDTNGLPMRIDVFRHDVPTGTDWWGNANATTTWYEIYLPGNAVVESCKLSWDGGAQARVGNTNYSSGSCPIPAPTTNYSSVTTTNYAFRSGYQTLTTLKLVTYQGSPDVQSVFINIDETQGTIAAMDGDSAHEIFCVGQIWINGAWIEMPKIKGRGNYTWSQAQDKKAYNITLGSKINFPGIVSAKTKKWSILAEISDHSLMCNRSGFALAHSLGVGQDTASADVWMNGEYQGCYTVTPKYDSFVTDDGYLLEEDNYLETLTIAEGGDPQFELEGMHGGGEDTSHYNIISVKKIGDHLFGEGGETPENIQAAADSIRPWMQDAWDAIRSATGYNAKGKHYSEYIDVESFAKMYLMQEYVKSYDVCAGSIFFHRDGQTEADKLIAGPLWDLDNAMGSTQENPGLGDIADRRSGAGAFVTEINEDDYKTSLYKTLYQHEDFRREVALQYNKNYQLFQSLPDVIQSMTDELGTSAKMNHRKVDRIGYNLHQYSNAATLESGTVYQQSMLKTSGNAVDNLSDWPNYAANLKTYAAARSLWFYNTYYDPDSPAFCEHTYVPVVTPPTCTTTGYTTYTCSKCGDSYVDDETPIIAHDYQNGVCTVCGQVLLTAAIVCSDGVSVTVYETADLSGPCVVNAESAHPRNSSTGLIDCSGDGQINFLVNLQAGYVLDSVTAEPANGFKNLKTPADTEVENLYRLTKVKKNLTITVTAHCTHNYAPTVTEPTCTAVGYTTWTCSYCGDSYTDTETPALGHDYIDHAAKAATCTEIGWNAYQTCSRCDYTSFEELPALGHDYIDHEAKAATCTEIGWNAYQTCSRCDYTTYEEIPAHGHTEAAAVEENRLEPTCTEAGSYDSVVYCSVCGAELSREPVTIDALGHDYINHEAKAAACTEIGWNAYQTCSRCDYTSYEELPALGHDYIDHEAKAATCTEIGWNAYQTCSRCDYTTYEEIPAHGHTEAAAVEENRLEPTCTEAGSYDSVVYCSVCGAELSREPVTIDALGHDYINHEAKAAACTEIGWNAYQTCSRCDYTSYEELPALGHDYIDHEAKAAACTEIGWNAYQTCSRCDYTTCEEIPALGHDYVNGVCTRCGAFDPDNTATDFSDVPERAYYHDAVYWALENHITNGTSPTTFSPNQPCTRAQIVTFLWRAAGSPEPSLTKNPFVDVPDHSYYAKAVLWAMEQGITNGTSSTTFSPNQPCTRAQTVTFLWRAAGRPEPLQTECSFRDVGEIAWYRKAVLWAVENQITNGISSTSFGSDMICTRAHVVTFLYRIA